MTMSAPFRIAWRNIWRHPRRTLLTTFAIAFAAAVLQFFISIQLKSYDSAISVSVGLFHGNIQIQRPGYHDRPEMRRALSAWQELRKAASAHEHVAAAAPRGIGFALLSSGERSYGVQVFGVEPPAEAAVSSIPVRVVKGEYLSLASQNEVVIGATLARNLKVEVGDELSLLGQGYDGSLAASVLKIRGVFESGSNDLDSATAQINLPDFQEIFSMQDRVHAIVVRAERLDNVQPVASSLQAQLGSTVAVLSWEQLLPGLKQSIQLDMAAGWLFYMALVIIVTFGIINTMLMSVLERTKEFGIMLAIGAEPLRVGLMVIIESIIIAVLGLILGIAIGSLLVAYYGSNGFSVPGTEEILRQWNLPGTVYPELSPIVIFAGPSVIFLMAFLGSLYPAFKAWRLQPLAGMRAA